MKRASHFSPSACSGASLGGEHLRRGAFVNKADDAIDGMPYAQSRGSARDHIV